MHDRATPAHGTDVAALLLINGPNLNLLGRREPGIYGRQGLPEIERDLIARARQSGHSLRCVQHNGEGQIVDAIQQAAEDTDLILINPGGYTHTSVAIRDALLAVDIPFIELHLSNPHAREPFRHRSLLSDVALGVICGFGPASYRLALQAAIEYLSTR